MRKMHLYYLHSTSQMPISLAITSTRSNYSHSNRRSVQRVFVFVFKRIFRYGTPGCFLVVPRAGGNRNVK